MRTSAAVPPGARLSRRNSSCRRGSDAAWTSRGGFVGRLFPPGGDRLLHAGRIGAEALRQRLEEGDARSGGQLGIAAEDFARQRHAGGLAAAGQQVLAQFDQALGAGGGVAAPVARQQRAAALGNGLQQFPEKRGVHLNSRDRS